MPLRREKGDASMITRCPGCGTAFRVTPEQLAAREGKVRCGRCAAVFDARETMQESGAEPPPREDERLEAGGTSFAAEPPESAAEPSGSPEPPSAEFEEAPDTQAAPSEFDAAPAARPAGRSRVWLAGSVLLVLVLLAQIAMQFRGDIALLFPETGTVFREICEILGCEVPLPRHADLIGIESSDLQADPSNPSVMVLTAMLRNRAMFPQSHPALELTLTDSQDQPVARRVLAPRDYLGQGASLDAGFPASSELAVKVFLEASSLKATGYRLYLFYP